MKIYLLFLFSMLTAAGVANQKALPTSMEKIMKQPKYDHAIWGIYVKDLQTGEVLYDLNSEAMFSPASTTKLFSVAALLDSYGDDHRFKTPVYITGPVENGELQGDLILVAQGDLTFGGRQPNADTLAFTKMDHIIANEVPGALLTPQSPLYAFDALAKQIAEKGIKTINGEVLIDDTLFDTTEKRGMIISPIMINENLIDLVVNPTEIGQKANVEWRPQVTSYSVENQVKTVDKDEKLSLEVSADKTGKKIIIRGTIPINQHDIVRTSKILDPSLFARAAFVQALEKQGIKIVRLSDTVVTKKVSQNNHEKQQVVAVWTSPPLSEYAKLILKVSHNMGADLVPLLLAAKNGKKTFEEGMLLLGDFTIKKINLSPNSFVFIDAAGGNENRLTPQDEITLLEYLHKKSPNQFELYFDALPILGVDGSLADFGKNTSAVGKVRAKTGTGVAFNLATEKFFLITQAAAGYVQGKNGHLLAYMVVVNNSTMRTIEDIFPIFEDVSLISSIIYEDSNNKQLNENIDN